MTVRCQYCDAVMPFPDLECPRCEGWIYCPVEQGEGKPASKYEIKMAMANTFTRAQWEQLPELCSRMDEPDKPLVQGGMPKRAIWYRS